MSERTDGMMGNRESVRPAILRYRATAGEKPQFPKEGARQRQGMGTNRLPSDVRRTLPNRGGAKAQPPRRGSGRYEPGFSILYEARI